MISVAAMLALTAALAPSDVAGRLPTENATLTAHASPSEPTHLAGMLVPKRVRLIIRYQRTALV